MARAGGRLHPGVPHRSLLRDAIAATAKTRHHAARKSPVPARESPANGRCYERRRGMGFLKSARDAPEGEDGTFRAADEKSVRIPLNPVVTYSP
jgi:hypothetical protein